MLEQLLKYVANRIEDDDPCLGEVQSFPPEAQAVIAKFTKVFEEKAEAVKALYGEIFELKKQMHQEIEVIMPGMQKENYKITPDGKSYRILHDEPQNQPRRKPQQPDWAKQQIEEWKRNGETE